jgi:hypothetical protein
MESKGRQVADACIRARIEIIPCRANKPPLKISSSHSYVILGSGFTHTNSLIAAVKNKISRFGLRRETCFLAPVASPQRNSDRSTDIDSSDDPNEALRRHRQNGKVADPACSEGKQSSLEQKYQAFL